jgi:LPXTG-motif cell wall-anchored protein
MKIMVIIFLLLLAIGFTGPSYVVSLEKAQDFTLTDTEGRPVSLSGYSGKYLLIDFFATWCSPCALQIIRLKNLHSQLGANLSIISIGIDPVSDSNQDLIEYKKKYGIDWAVALDTEHVGIKYRVTAIPTLALIDPGGNLVRTWIGVTEESAIIQELPFKTPSQTPSSSTPAAQPSTGYAMTTAMIVVVVLAIILSIIVLRRRKRQTLGSQRGKA